MDLRTIRQGSTGPLVRMWQNFLLGHGLYHGHVDGVFGPGTDAATRSFQALPPNSLKADGWVGSDTYGKAMVLGFDPVNHATTETGGPTWPAPPTDLKPLVGTGAKQKAFGKFRFKHSPVNGSPENVTILDGWRQKNIRRFDVPQLNGLLGTYGRTDWDFHVRVGPRVQELFYRWEEEGLIDRVLSWGGSFAPRFIRGSRSRLSNHAFGSAFDINVPWNGLGRRPALVGQKGSVRELVPIAAELGFYWGGWWAPAYGGTRADAMHFEATEKALVDGA